MNPDSHRAAMPGLYVHVPFCARKCAYCDFYSVEDGPAAQEAYLRALELEFETIPPGFACQTVYVGGGTPTVLDPNRLGRLFASIRRHVPLDADAMEWTCEANPGTLTAEKAELLKRAGVNRISLGIQSFDDRVLSFLGRIHTAAEAEEAFACLRACGFANLGLDLIYGIPDTPPNRLSRDLDKVIQLGPEHVSCYGLTFEPGTPLTALRDRGGLREVQDEDALAEYTLIRQTLAKAGFQHYEISNFCRPGFESKHNLLYWSGGEYVGLGPSAHSHWDGVRYGNVRSLDGYCGALEAGQSPRESGEKLDPAAKARETLVMGLRKIKGVDRASFRALTGFDYEDLAGPAIARLSALGMLQSDERGLRLTDQALFISSAVFAELI